MSDIYSSSSPLLLSRRAWWGVVGIVLFVAALLRLTDLGGVPPGVFRDEVEKGYSALELWSTGRQGVILSNGMVESSRFAPVFLDAGGVKTSAIYQYLSAPFVGAFGLNRWTTRIVAALVGLITVWLAGCLAGRLETGEHFQAGDRPMPYQPAEGAAAWVALLAMVFAAVSPTHVLFSRWAQQGITVPLFFTAGVLAVLKLPTIAEKNQRALAIGAGFLFGLAFYAYAPMRLVVPLILLGLAWEMAGNWRRLVRIYWPAAAVFFLIAIPVFIYATTQGSGRFARISVFADRSFFDGLALALGNWLHHFDTRFLFMTGDTNPRHALPLGGLLAWAETPFFLLGLASLVPWRRSGSRLLLVWLLSAPVAAALTNEGIPHALRSILFFPAVHLISARGVLIAGRWLAPRPLAVIVAIAFIVSASLTGIALFDRIQKDGPPWQYGVLEALETLWRENPNGPNVLSAEIPYAHYYILYFEQPEPAEFHEFGFDATRTMILAPGQPLPMGAWVARPNTDLFGRAEGFDIPAPSGDPLAPPAMRIRRGW